MDNVKNDAYYVQKVKKDVLFIVTHMRGVDAEELEKRYAGVAGNVRRRTPLICKRCKSGHLFSLEKV